MKRSFSLRTKSAAAIIAFVVAVSSTIAFFLIRQERAIVYEQYRERGIALCKNLAYNSEYGILTGNSRLLENLADGVMDQPDVLFCAILNNKGEIMAERKKAKYEIHVPAIGRLKDSGKETIFHTHKGIRHYGVREPVTSGETEITISEEGLFLQEDWIEQAEAEKAKGERKKIGYVFIGLSLERADLLIEKSRNAVIRIALFMVIILGISGAAGTAFALRPVRQMVDATRKISSGDLSIKIPVRARDELGILAESFNKMTDDLKKTTVSRDYMDNIIKSMFEMLIALDSSGDIETVNKAVCDTLGYSRDELVKKKFNVLFYKPSEASGMFGGKGAVAPDIAVKDFETTLVTKKGRLIPVLFSAVAVNGTKEAARRVVCVATDVTHIKDAENKLKKLNEDLARREKAVLNILSDLRKSHGELKSSQQQLVQQGKLASLGRLVSDMAHEVNNPLMVISGRAQIALMSEIQDEELKESLGIIVDQCARAKDIIQRLLMFSRPSKEETKEVEINEVIEFVLKLIEHQYSLEDIKVVRKFGKGLPHVKVDEKQIHEVLMNLCRNSADAMIPGGGTLTIKTSMQGDMVRIDVTDTGSGISEEALQKIFDPFFTTKEHGTGLGLSVCYGIIQSHGGELKYTSEAGKGTTATILLPAIGDQS